MLNYNGGVYYGSKKTLNKFALEMGIEEPDLQTATKTKMKKQLIKAQKPKSPLPPSEEDEEDEEDDKDEEDIDIDELIQEPEDKDEDEDVEGLKGVIHDVSTEKPLTKQQQQMIDQILKCIGI